MGVLRDQDLQPFISFQYPEDAPLFIVGDFNFVGTVQNIKTILTGDIVDNDEYGSDFTPDWDGTSLADAAPYVTGFPANYTWSQSRSSYNTGRLDFIIYSDSEVKVFNSFASQANKLRRAPQQATQERPNK